jgi:hypothetical protein
MACIRLVLLREKLERSMTIAMILFHILFQKP